MATATAMALMQSMSPKRCQSISALRRSSFVQSLRRRGWPHRSSRTSSACWTWRVALSIPDSEPCWGPGRHPPEGRFSLYSITLGRYKHGPMAGALRQHFRIRRCLKTRSGFERLFFLAVRRCYRSRDCTKAAGLSAWLHPAASRIRPTSPASPSLAGGKNCQLSADDEVFRKSLLPISSYRMR